MSDMAFIMNPNMSKNHFATHRGRNADLLINESFLGSASDFVLISDVSARHAMKWST